MLVAIVSFHRFRYPNKAIAPTISTISASLKCFLSASKWWASTALVLAREAAGVPNTVDARHFDELKKHFNEAEIVEIVGAIALFGYLNRWNDTMATNMETHPAQVAVQAMPDWDGGKHGMG